MPSHNIHETRSDREKRHLDEIALLRSHLEILKSAALTGDIDIDTVSKLEEQLAGLERQLRTKATG